MTTLKGEGSDVENPSAWLFRPNQSRPSSSVSLGGDEGASREEDSSGKQERQSQFGVPLEGHSQASYTCTCNYLVHPYPSGKQRSGPTHPV